MSYYGCDPYNSVQSEAVRVAIELVTQGWSLEVEKWGTPDTISRRSPSMKLTYLDFSSPVHWTDEGTQLLRTAWEDIIAEQGGFDEVEKRVVAWLESLKL